MTPSITYLSPTDIAERRSELLERAGLELDTLRQRGAEYRLSPEQAAVLKDLEDLVFLAGGSPDGACCLR
ncbi:hypothetical protein [Cellulomonas fimi]|uniref:Uncharacterized protein n=1 Tax=Cellulomonas fimi TaxID=1708 RepID=A0A7Y0LWW4_CELFI|nr:hypothetical protein [Cellulomonas fimi]NMR19736.1 hypothetical protein [Cellulomonas fimi]